MSDPGGHADGGTTSADFYAAVRPGLDSLRRLAEAYRNASQSAALPAHNSQAMADMAVQPRYVSDEWPQPIDNLHSASRIVTWAAFDHLDAYARVFDKDNTPVFAHLSLLRSSLVAFGFSAWLCDPTASTVTRMQRGLAFDLLDAVNRDRYGHDELKDGGRRIKARIRAGAARHRWTVVANGRSQRVGDEAVPTTAELIGRAIGPAAPLGRAPGGADPVLDTPRFVWSYLSGVDHSFTFALMQSIQPSQAPATIPGLVNANLQTSADRVLIFGAALASAAVTGGGRLLHHMGLATKEWTQAVIDVKPWANKLGASAQPSHDGSQQDWPTRTQET